MKKITGYLTAFVCSVTLLTSCVNSSGTGKLEKVPELAAKDSSEKLLPAMEVSKSFTKIVFKDVSVTLFNFLVADEEGQLDKVQNDSTSVFAELGESIEGQVIEVNPRELQNIKIEQRYETSVTVMNEGPHCDLLDWKHYYSPWKPLQKTVTGQFVALLYTDKERGLFPSIRIDELRTRVASQCGKEWLQQIKEISNPSQLPSAIGISRYFLRITGERKSDHMIVTKIITIEVPMGC